MTPEKSPPKKHRSKKPGSKKSHGTNALVFVPLGGVGEIGMNLYLYGYGQAGAYTWLIVDMGITFGGEYEPGIDVILPDIRFLEEERHNIAGLVLTHAHEDHYGAVADLWPMLGHVPIFATPFTAEMLRGKFADMRVAADDLPLEVVPLGAKRRIGPFDVELICMSHSIPEPTALAITTPVGSVLHTGDWKLDICDSTNAIREGVSPSEADVAENLEKLIKKAPACVAVTTFASNVARLGSVAKAARAAGRELVVVGRAMYRVIEAAQATGYLDPDLRFHNDTAFAQFAPDKVVALCTGSQGETRAAMARIASGTHPNITLKVGDWVIFSSLGMRRPWGGFKMLCQTKGSKSSPTRTGSCMCPVIRGAVNSNSSMAG